MFKYATNDAICLLVTPVGTNPSFCYIHIIDLLLPVLNKVIFDKIIIS